jgi:hypothetical protein
LRPDILNVFVFFSGGFAEGCRANGHFLNKACLEVENGWSFRRPPPPSAAFRRKTPPSAAFFAHVYFFPEVLAHGHYWDRNGRRTDGAVEGSGADFWFYVAAPEDGRRPLQRSLRTATMVLAHGFLHLGCLRAATEQHRRFNRSRAKERPKWIILSEKRCLSFAFRRLPPASTGLGGGLFFFTVLAGLVFAHGHYCDGEVARRGHHGRHGQDWGAGARVLLGAKGWGGSGRIPSIPALSSKIPSLRKILFLSENGLIFEI